MKRIYLFIWLIMLGIYCEQKPSDQETIFEKEAVRFLSTKYKLNYGKAASAKKDSLRSEIFYSQYLQRVMYYNLLNPTNGGDTLGVFFTIYTYRDSSNAAKIIRLFKSNFERSLNEGFYGPIDKDLQIFFSGSNCVIHLEMGCGYDEEREMLIVGDSVMQIGRNFFGPITNFLVKPCE